MFQLGMRNSKFQFVGTILVSILLLNTVLGISGCTITLYEWRPSEEELATKDFGVAPSDYVSDIKEYLNESLYDPFSAEVLLGEPRKAFFGSGKNKVYCWMVYGKVNAKNRLGGYVGWRKFMFYFKDGEFLGGVELPEE